MHDPQQRPSATAGLMSLAERMRDHDEEIVLQEVVAVEDVMVAILETMDGRLTPTEARLLQEMAGLGRIIDQAKTDVACLSVDAIRGSHIPSATDQLDAIVEHTAIATNSILESCEALDDLAGSLDKAHAAVLQNATTQIYEACSFQDITGQRITKVIAALQSIEARVLGMSASYGLPAAEPAPTDVLLRPVSLLNGPALTHEAMGQDDIDKLLADF